MTPSKPRPLIITNNLEEKLSRLGSALRVLRQAVEEVNTAWLESPEELKQLIGLRISFTGNKDNDPR